MGVAITMDDLTVSMGPFDETSLLSDWVWLIGPSRFPILLTAAGDAFLQDRKRDRSTFGRAGGQLAIGGRICRRAAQSACRP